MEYVGNMSLVTVWVSVTGCGGYITVGFWLTTSGFIALLLEQMQEQTGLTLKAGWLVGWLVALGLSWLVWGLTAFLDNISVYIGPSPKEKEKQDWLVGCFGFNGPLRQYFSLYRAVSQREGERRERIDESKNIQTIPTRTYCKRNRPLPYCNQNCRTPRHWKFTQHHRTTRLPPEKEERKDR